MRFPTFPRTLLWPGMLALAVVLVMMAGCSNLHRAMLANPGLDQQPMRGVFYFPGNWEREATPRRPTAEFYGRYRFLGGNELKYTLHPAQAYHLGFSESAAARTQAVADIAATHANVIVMSYWGPPLTDNWMFWAPMQDAPRAQEELFDAVLGQNLVVMPSIEDSQPTNCKDVGGTSPRFRLADEFPNGVDRVIQNGPVNPLLERIVDLVTRFITHPRNAEWPAHFARMYDREGNRRYIIHLKDVSSTQTQPVVTPESFAEGFVRLAQAVKTMTGGVDVGFTIDPLEVMLVPDKPEKCGEIPAKTTYIPSTPEAREALAKLKEVVAVQAYRSEITEAGKGDNRHGPMIAHKRQFIADWLSAGMPVIADVSAGYDGRLIFAPDAKYIYGHNDVWRNDQSQLRSGQISGLMFTAWNGYTEGWAGMPTLESGTDGTDPAAMNRWLQAIFTPNPCDCNHVHFADGRPLYFVYGAICEKYYRMGGSRGTLGLPLSSEHAGNVAGVRRTDFQHGSILWKGGPEAFEVHGRIGEHYKQMGYESARRLGVPTSDERNFSGCPHGESGRYNQFELGKLVYCSKSDPEVQIYP